MDYPNTYFFYPSEEILFDPKNFYIIKLNDDI